MKSQLQIILETSGCIRRVHIRFQIQQGEHDAATKKRETHISLEKSGHWLVNLTTFEVGLVFRRFY